MQDKQRNYLDLINQRWPGNKNMQLKSMASSLLFSSLLLSVLLVLALAPIAETFAAENIEPALTADELALSQWLDEQEDDMVEMIERITNINSGRRYFIFSL